MIACKLQQRRPTPSKRLHLDKMVLQIGCGQMYLWRAVDHEGKILDMIVQRRRDKRAALTGIVERTTLEFSICHAGTLLSG
jgi:transposase-like protein